MMVFINRFFTWFVGESSPFDVFEGTLILVFFAYEIWFAEMVRERWRRRRLRDTFDLRLVTIRWDTTDTRNGFISAQLRINQATEIRTFNVRFVEGRDGGNLAQLLPVQIVAVNDRQHELVAEQDFEGGCECHWRDHLPRKLYAGKDLFLDMRFIINRPVWAGYLSYQGWDALDEKRYSRIPIEITRPAPLSLEPRD
jgi:hypothetical protein